MFLREGVAVADVGIFDAVQKHVHAADAEHGVVEIEGVEKFVVKMVAHRIVTENLGMVDAQILAHRDGEATSAAGKIAHDIPGHGLEDFHHELDDVARGAELAVLPGAGDLTEHVFVEVALGVAVLHGHLLDHIHHLGQQGRRGDGEAGVLHVVRVGGAVAAHGAQKGEDMLAHDDEHLGGGEVLEAGPAQILVGAASCVSALGENPAGHGLLEAGGFALLQGLEVIEALEEKQVGDLLDDFDGVGDAAAPEGIPEGIDFTADIAGEHKRG